MGLTQVAQIAALVSGIGALFVLSNGIIEYGRRGRQVRAEQFIRMRSRLKENATFKEICALLETDDPKLIQIPFADKRDFLGFFEEVALMMNSNLIKKEVAHYMFGYYAIQCWRSDNFWKDVNRESVYWSVFRDFSSQMEKLEKSLEKTIGLDRRRFQV